MGRAKNRRVEVVIESNADTAPSFPSFLVSQ